MPGLTKAQIADAKAKGVEPTRSGGFGYMRGPDHALVEYAGNHAAERFNHVHLYQDDPFCAQLWYQKHLNAPVFAGRTSSTPLTETTCQVPRGPDGAAGRPSSQRACSGSRRPRSVFGDVAFAWYMRQSDRPLVGSRGQLYDHIALSVSDLDAWVTKLRDEGRHVPRRALHARQHARRDDRGPKPRSARAGRGQVDRSLIGALRFLRPDSRLLPEVPPRHVADPVEACPQFRRADTNPASA